MKKNIKKKLISHIFPQKTVFLTYYYYLCNDTKHFLPKAI